MGGCGCSDEKYVPALSCCKNKDLLEVASAPAPPQFAHVRTKFLNKGLDCVMFSQPKLELEN